MAYNFPLSPNVGDGYQGYTWDGEKWLSPMGGVGAVRYDTPQALSAAEQAQARTNISVNAANPVPSDNILINGGMEVSQEFGATATTKPAAYSYTLDMWNGYMSGTGTAGFAQEAVPVGTIARGFRNHLRYYCGTAFTMAGGGDLMMISQEIEGTRFARLGFGAAGALNVTVSFWIYATNTGTISLVLKNGPGGRSYPMPITINSPNTWEYKTVTFPGDTMGTWPIDNTLGARLCFVFGAGSGYKLQAPSAWNTDASCFGHIGMSNLYATASANVSIAGVTMLPGNVGPTAAQSPLMMRNYAEDLQLCLRYWEKTYHNIAGSQDNASNNHLTWFFKVTKRAVPTFTAAAGSLTTGVYATEIDGVNVYKSNSPVVLNAGSTAAARL